MKSFLLSACIILTIISCSPRTAGPQATQKEIWVEEEKQRQIVARDKIEKQQNKGKKKIKMAQRLLRVAGKISEASVELCGRLSKKPSLCVYGYSVSDADDLNAYADGDDIVISQSMMNFLKTDNELAYVLAHEYAHNMMEHIADKKFNVIAGAVLGALVDGLVGNTGGDFSEAGAKAGALAYSPGYEAEADYVGLYIATLAGYNVNKAPDIWRRMAVKHPDSIYISITHPSTASRFVAMEKVVKEIAYKKRKGLELIPELKKKTANN